MRLLINASTLSGSGVTQVCVSFLTESINLESHTYLVLMSERVQKELDIASFPDNYTFITINNHPIKGLSAIRSQRQIRRAEKDFGPDLVFSVFGPSYWTPTSPHLMGFAFPHIVYRDSPYFNNISWYERYKCHFVNWFRYQFLIRNGKFFVTETPDVTNRLGKLLGNSKQIFTVGNTYSSVFANPMLLDNVFFEPDDKGKFRFLSLCTFMSHKNLLILNEVIPILSALIPQLRFSFVLTIDERYMQYFSLEARAHIENVGRVSVKDCPQLYSEIDAVWLPTTLECFSANYPEAMIMERPIATSNLSFATSICENAAVYFDPYNPKEIALRLVEIINSDTLREKLVNNGKKVLKKFISAEGRAKDYLNICENIVSEGVKTK